jgi:hypothetical protein
LRADRKSSEQSVASICRISDERNIDVHGLGQTPAPIGAEFEMRLPIDFALQTDRLLKEPRKLLILKGVRVFFDLKS